MRNIIIDLQKPGSWKVQLTLADNVISSKYVDEERVMCLIRNALRMGLERAMREIDFIFDSVQLLYYKCHKIDFKCGGSNRVSWLDKKQSTINPKTKDDKCFQYVVTVALH